MNQETVSARPEQEDSSGGPGWAMFAATNLLNLVFVAVSIYGLSFVFGQIPWWVYLVYAILFGFLFVMTAAFTLEATR